jgi:transglutaminase-like putative cysteine protease
MLLHLHHETRYCYSPAVENAHHVVHLQPVSSTAQTVLSHQLRIYPAPDHQRETPDVYGNQRTFFSLQRSHRKLNVSAHSVVQTHSAAASNPPPDSPWEHARERYRYRAGSTHDAAWQFVFASPLAPNNSEFAEFASISFTPGRPIAEAAHHLMTRIHHEMEYDGDATDVNTPALDALRQRKGVCQDFAHIMVACCRALGLPARYVSGYMLTHPAPGTPRLIGCDASHAWASVYCPGPAAAHDSPTGAPNPHGQWLDFDPTNNRVPLDDYITLATGRDYLDVSPLRGVLHGGARHTLRVAVTVTPMEHAAKIAETAETLFD